MSLQCKQKFIGEDIESIKHKRKIDQLNLIKIKNLRLSRKWKATEQESVFAVHVSDSGLTCRIYNDPWQLNNNKQPNFFNGQTLKQILYKRRYTNGQSAYFKMPTLLVIGHMKIKTTVTYQYTPTRILKKLIPLLVGL